MDELQKDDPQRASSRSREEKGLVMSTCDYNDHQTQLEFLQKQIKRLKQENKHLRRFAGRVTLHFKDFPHSDFYWDEQAIEDERNSLEQFVNGEFHEWDSLWFTEEDVRCNNALKYLTDESFLAVAKAAHYYFEATSHKYNRDFLPSHGKEFVKAWQSFDAYPCLACLKHEFDASQSSSALVHDECRAEYDEYYTSYASSIKERMYEDALDWKRECTCGKAAEVNFEDYLIDDDF